MFFRRFEKLNRIKIHFYSTAPNWFPKFKNMHIPLAIWQRACCYKESRTLHQYDATMLRGLCLPPQCSASPAGGAGTPAGNLEALLTPSPPRPSAHLLTPLPLPCPPPLHFPTAASPSTTSHIPPLHSFTTPDSKSQADTVLSELSPNASDYKLGT
jgi:hypothetical protein